MITLILALSACVVNPLKESPHNVVLNPERTGVRVTFTVARGPAWSDRVTEGPVRFNVLPQIAAWMETPDGRFVDTLYVTGALGGPWTHASKGSKGRAFYIECFPAWSHRVLNSSNHQLPGPETPYTDGYTSATPQSTFLVSTIVPIDTFEDGFVLYAEVNRSGDYNAAHPKPESGDFDPIQPEKGVDWDGQPSVVYKADVIGAGRGDRFVLKPVGHGDPGAPRHIDPDLAQLDTALQIVDEIDLVIR